jgi:NADH dehydrogenase [ubiquinone] 1 alpha subcomplex assembly factor 7
MTPLEPLLIRQIASSGPMTIAEYMTACLLHPEHGYYTTRDPFGTAGDFTTAPEISQMFGELIGLCLAQSWLDQGSPAAFTLAELGPGRGTLMADLLRATRGIPGFHAAANVTLIEASPALRAHQRKALGNHHVRWCDTTHDLPDAPLFLIANEFFDALPIRQFTRHSNGWAETVVGLKGGGLTLGQTDPAPLAMIDHRLADTTPGQVVEICPSAGPIMNDIATRIAGYGGLALIIDYGDWQSRGDTLQAMRSHKYVSVVNNPGQSDLTAHVDFAALAAQAVPCATRYTAQGQFLTQLGLPQRSARLAASLGGPALEQHLLATTRLTAATEMGTLFKVLAVHAMGAPAPPGFD